MNEYESLLDEKISGKENKKLSRKEANELIIEGLRRYFEINPDIRFIQGLWGLKLITQEDLFHEEPVETLRRLNEELPSLFWGFKGVKKYYNYYNDVIDKLEENTEKLNLDNAALTDIIRQKDTEIKNLKLKNENLLLELADMTKRDKETMEEFVRILISKEAVINNG